jgi:hypothetical protein
VKISDKMLRQSAAQARELWLDTLPRKEEVPEYSVSPSFQENMDRIMRQARHTEKHKTFLRSFGRVAAVLLLVTTVSFAGLMTASANFREKVLQIVSQVFSDHTQYNYNGSQEDAALPELQLDALPEGFMVLSDEQFEQQSRHIHCKDDTGNYLDIDVCVISANGGGTQTIDTEDAQVSVLDIHGREVTIVSKNDWYILLWTEDSAVITLESNIELQELIAFVEGITNRQ